MTDKKEPVEKGTIRIHSYDELNKIADQFRGRLVSPGGAASRLGVSRAYIHQLEKGGKIRAYRMRSDETIYDDLPYLLRLFIDKSRRPDYIYIPIEDLEEYRKNVRSRKGKKK